jgi:hypothetical protein
MAVGESSLTRDRDLARRAARSRLLWGAALAAAFVAGVALGPLWRAPWASLAGGASAPDAQRPSRATPGGARGHEQELEAALESSWQAVLHLATRVDSLESRLREIREGRLDTRQLVRVAVDDLGEQEIRSMLASTAQLGPEELDQVTDLRAFARRMAEVAMDGVVEPGEDADEDSRVVFTTGPVLRDPQAVARSRFGQDQGRIYAIFPTGSYQRDAVMTKWYRSDPPQILLFQRHAVHPGAAYSYVWLEPDPAWEPGQYRVDIYAADEAVTRLASGGYTVVR